RGRKADGPEIAIAQAHAHRSITAAVAAAEGPRPPLLAAETPRPARRLRPCRAAGAAVASFWARLRRSHLLPKIVRPQPIGPVAVGDPLRRRGLPQATWGRRRIRCGAARG